MKNNLDLDDYSDDYPDMPDGVEEKAPSSGAAAAPLADKKEDDTSDDE